MQISEKNEKIIASIFFLVYSFIFLFISVRDSNYEYIFYNIAMLKGFIILLTFYKKIHLKVSLFIGLVVLGFLHLAGGNLIVNEIILYQTSLLKIPYDKIVHFFGSFVITIIAYNFIYGTLSKEDKKKTLLIGFIILMIGIGIGAIIEIIEFLVTRIFEFTIVGDYANNAADLIANALGALIAVIFTLVHFKKK